MWRARNAEFRFLSFVLNAFPSTLPPIKNGCSTRRKGEDKTREDKTMNTNRKEQWKAIKGYEGKYEVSNKGNVRTLNYKNTGVTKVIKTNKNKSTGYMQVGLYDRNSQKSDNFYVHRLVAETFIPNPNNMKFVDHIDGCRTRNCVSNLRWTTRQFNNSRKRTKLLKS